MAKSLGEAGWMFGVREDDQDEHQLQMSLHHYHQFQHQSPAEKNPSMVTSASPSTQKKKRTHPDPDAEVIALSPKTLMETNRFICEVCKKGFQREQNLQLHRRGHNLPWKLKQKSTNEVRKKVYLCPEPTCVHHHPSRALGDLTGIKKHFSRKHGEKKWKCEKCSKTYAVLSDWKAHSKTCGTKEYRCDCGTLFSRRDSFVTHQAFCDALTRQDELNPTNLSAITSNIFGPSRGIIANQHQVSPYRQGGLNFQEDSFRYSYLLPPFIGSAIRPNTNTIFGSPNYHEEDQAHHSPKKLVFKYGMMHQLSQDQILREHADHTFFSNIATKNDNIESPTDDIRSTHLSSSNLFANHPGRNEVNACGEIGGRLTSGAQGSSAGLFSSDNVFMGDQISPLYSSLQNNNNASASAHLSATALLQKAAQVGSSCSIINGSSSIHRSLGSSSSSSKHDDLQAISLGATSFGALLGDPQNNKHLHELMSSLGGGGSTTRSSMFGSLAKENNDNVCTGEYASNEETKFSFDEYSKVNIGGCDRLTRDFMGVGQIVRQMSGGFSQTSGLQMTSKDIDRRN
ncbi:hypothetical protein QQ045_016710 [Rhodiola kirilowii]